MMSGGKMSGRIESSWPNLTKVGPSSSSISRRWRPRSDGRFEGGVPVSGQQIAQLVSLEEVAEAVPDSDLRDLGDALRLRGGA